MNTKDKQKFHDVEAEEQLLRAAIEIRKIALSPEFGQHLFTGERVQLCNAIISLNRRNESVTPKHLEISGCDEAAILAFSLIGELPHYPDTGEAAVITDKLTALALRRFACDTMRDLHADAGTLEPPQLLTRLNELATGAQRVVDGNCAKDMIDGADLNELLDDIRRRIENPDKLSGLSLGMGLALDRALDGLQGGRLILIGGRPHLGKTSLGIQIASGIMEEGGSVAYFSAEMTKLHLQQAMVDLHSGVQLRPGITPDKGELIKIGNAAKKIAKFRFHIDDSDRVAINSICSKARMLHRTKGLDAVVVDYAQIIMGSDVRDDMRLMISEISGKCKALSKELGIPVILLSQINRALPRTDPKTGGNIYPRPTLANLKESSSLESDSDVVILIDRNLESENPNDNEVDCDLILAKNRQTGLLTTVPVSFNRRHRCFTVKHFWSPF